MKKLFTLLLICFPLLGYAQNFLITDSLGNPYTNEQVISVIVTEDMIESGEYVIKFDVNNLTSGDLLVKTLRTNLQLPEGISAEVCFGECFEEDILYIDWTIPAGRKEGYALHILVGDNFKGGVCQFKLDFWSEDDKSDMVALTANIEFTLGVNTYKNEKISLSASPNPASANSNIKVSYTLADKNNNYQLVIRNILGATIMDMPLNPYEDNISINASNLKSGVYFYAIENNNHILTAKKLIVR